LALLFRTPVSAVLLHYCFIVVLFALANQNDGDDKDANLAVTTASTKHQTLLTDANNRFHKIFRLMSKHRTRLTYSQCNIHFQSCAVRYI